MANDRQASGSHDDGPRRLMWLSAIGIVLALLGAGISIYSVAHHLEYKVHGQTDAMCNINDALSCDATAGSAFSELFGIPLGIYGLGYFLALGFLLVSVCVQSKSLRENLYAYGVLVGCGVVASVGLGAIAATQIGVVCPTCVGIYVVCALQAGLLLVFWRPAVQGFDGKLMLNGVGSAGVVLLFTVVLFNLTRDWWTPRPEQIAPAPAVEIPVNVSPYVGNGEDYRRGADPEEARLVIVEFVDFQCPACAHLAFTIRPLIKDYGDQVAFVFKNYPLDRECNGTVQAQVHEFACDTAIMARCAGMYGKFWEYHDLAFAGHRDIDAQAVRDWGKQVGLTDAQMDACEKADDLVAKVVDDITLGKQLGVTGTPALFFNGQMYRGSRGTDQLRSEIERILNEET